MKPYPASTINTAAAGAAATLVVWVLKTWGNVEMGAAEAGALSTIFAALACHFTDDAP